MKARSGVALILLSILMATCKQDPIFFIISTETAPIKPRIEGAPTNMVVFERVLLGRDEPVPIMYVASGRIHWYAKDIDTGEPKWDLKGDYAIPQPRGKVISLAVAGDRLYALCRDGSGVNSKLRYITATTAEWTTIDFPEYPVIQSIYADPVTTRLFAGAGRRDFTLFSIDNNDDTRPHVIVTNTSMFTGVARQEIAGENVYYLATAGDGIYRLDENTMVPVQLVDTTDFEESSLNNKRIFSSIIKLNNDSIIAVERNGGALYAIEGDSLARIRCTSENNNSFLRTGNYSTHAVSTWQEFADGSGIKLLIVGIQGGLFTTATSSYTYGYVEFFLNDDWSLDTSRFSQEPSVSVDRNRDRYTATLGKHPVNHFFQAPVAIDPNITFFASTQTAGLWSYHDRSRDGGLQWNAEQ